MSLSSSSARAARCSAAPALRLSSSNVSLASLARTIAAESRESFGADSNSGHRRLASSASSHNRPLSHSSGSSGGGGNSSHGGGAWATPDTSRTTKKRPRPEDDASAACRLADVARTCACLRDASALLRQLVVDRLPPHPGHGWTFAPDVMAAMTDADGGMRVAYDCLAPHMTAYYGALADVARRFFERAPPAADDMDQWRWLTADVLALTRDRALPLFLHLGWVAPYHCVHAALCLETSDEATAARRADMLEHALLPSGLADFAADPLPFFHAPDDHTGAHADGALAQALCGSPLDAWLALECVILRVPGRALGAAFGAVDSCAGACGKHSAAQRVKLRDACVAAQGALCAALAWLVDALNAPAWKAPRLGPTDLDVFARSADAAAWPPRVCRLWLVVHARGSPAALRALEMAAGGAADETCAVDDAPFLLEHVLPFLARRYLTRWAWRFVDANTIDCCALADDRETRRVSRVKARHVNALQSECDLLVRERLLPACRDIAQRVLPAMCGVPRLAGTIRRDARATHLAPAASQRLLDQLRGDRHAARALPACIASMLTSVADAERSGRGAVSFGHGGRRALAGWLLDLVGGTDDRALRELCVAIVAATGVTAARQRPMIDELWHTLRDEARNKGSQSLGCGGVIRATRDPGTAAKQLQDTHRRLHCPYATEWNENSKTLGCRKRCLAAMSGRPAAPGASVPQCPSEMLRLALDW